MDKNRGARKNKVTRPLTQKQVLEKIEKGESFAGVEIGDVDFSKHIFKKDVDFYNALFTGRAIFQNASFQGKASFFGAHFSSEANFLDVKFKSEVEFDLTEFHGETYFGGAHFKNRANFSNALYKEKAHFVETRFDDKAFFFLAQFHKQVWFTVTKFQAGANFEHAQFLGEATFVGDEKNRVFSNAFQTNLKAIKFQKPEHVVFQTVDLSKCSFNNTSLSKVELTDIIWPIEKTLLGSRRVVYDEIVGELKDKKYVLIEKIYRDLKKNYENRGSYGEAGDFHYGEMEMRRLSQKGIFRYASLLWLYKTLSGYGEKYLRAIFWLGAFLLVYLGAYRFIEYNALPFRDGLWNSLIHTLQVITFQTDRSYYPKTDWGTLADAGLKVFIPLQATLAILAIKRKFKR